jgi:DNA helicase IV
LLEGPSFVYGHLIVDEAQDLSPMDLRMLGRRSIDGSMTVLGDLAQATGVAAQTRWLAAIESLASSAPAQGLRTESGLPGPGPIMEFANRLLPMAAHHVDPTRSVRTDGEEPIHVWSEDGSLPIDAVGVALAMAERLTTVGLIAPESRYEEMKEALSDAGSDWSSEELGSRVTLLHPAAAKGLEFDGVVVVEPLDILDEHLHGARMLYVALTRAVQELAVVYARGLPKELQLPAPVVAGRDYSR